MTTKINLPSSISSHPAAFVVAYVFATIDSKEYSWAITRSEFDSLPWAITDTSDGSDNSRDYATRFEFAILNAIRSLHHIRIVKPSIYLVDPPIDFDMNWLHGYEFTILEIDPQGEITSKDVNLPTLYVEDEDDSDDSDDSDEPVAVAEIIEPVAAEEVAPKLDTRNTTPAATDNGGITQANYANKLHEAGRIAEYQAAKDTILIKIRELNRIIKANKFGGAKFVQAKLDKIQWQGRLDSINDDLAWAKQAKRELKQLEKQAKTKQEVAPTIEITTLGEITESDVNFTDGEWEITPTPDGSNSGNTPDGHNTLKSAVALHFNADKATKSEHAYYLAFWRKLAKSNSCKREICGQMVTITRLEKGDFAVSAQPIAPQPEMPAPDWHTIIDDIAISDFDLIDSSEWADHISEAEKEFDAMMETERAEMQCDDYEAEQAIERKNSATTPRFQLLATEAPVKPKKATRAKFVQMTGMLFDTPKVSTADLIARRAAQRKALGDRLPPAQLFR